MVRNPVCFDSLHVLMNRPYSQMVFQMALSGTVCTAACRCVDLMDSFQSMIVRFSFRIVMVFTSHFTLFVFLYSIESCLISAPVHRIGIIFIPIVLRLLSSCRAASILQSLHLTNQTRSRTNGITTRSLSLHTSNR